MKRFLLLSVVLALGASVVLWSPATAQAGPPSFPGNGDVNDDGSRDLSDAVYLLTHLFQGGPGPVDCPNVEPPQDPEVLLPATNQTVCYETTFVADFPLYLPLPDCDTLCCAALPPAPCEVESYPACWAGWFAEDETPDPDPCYCEQHLAALVQDPDETFGPDGTIEHADCETAPDADQDGALQVGCPTADRFVDNTDGTVTDTCTGLMWTQDILDATGDGVRDHNDNVNWCAALTLGENLDFSGNDDWRLPSIRELESIADYSGTPAINPVFADFVIDPGNPGDEPPIPPRGSGFIFWSSTTFDQDKPPESAVIGNMDLAYSMYFEDSENVAVSLKYAGSRTVCRKSDDNCDCAGQIPTDPLCVDFDRDKIFARAVRTVPLSGGAAGGQGAATLGNGDVNGDNGLDLSDPIYLLTFLFQGGPAPLPCPGSGGGAGIPSVVNVGRLPSTLTDNCYEEVFPDDWGTAADCDAAIASCPGQDSFYQQVAENVHSCYGQSSSVDRFVINGDGTVTDHCTNLMWARGRPWPVPEPGGRIEWAEALAWSETLVYTTSRAFKPEAQAVLDGDEIAYDGWRMPNIRELETIADFDLAGQNLAGTLQARRALYWSSTTIPSRPDLVFGLGGHGPARLHVKKNDPRMHIRPCRTITPPP